MAMPQVSSSRAQVMAAGSFREAVAFTAAFARTTAVIPKNVQMVRLVATQDCFINFGDQNVEADSGDIWVPGGVIENWQVTPNATFIAAVRDQSDGILYVLGLI